MSDLLFHQRDLQEERMEHLANRVPVFDHPPRLKFEGLPLLIEAIDTGAMLLSKGYQQRGSEDCLIRLSETRAPYPMKRVEMWYFHNNELRHVCGMGQDFRAAYASARRMRRQVSNWGSVENAVMRPGLLEDFEDGDVALIPERA